MKNDYSTALASIRPDKQWSLYGGTYEGLVWHDDIESKPTQAEIEAAIVSLDAAEPMRLLRIERDKRLAETDWWAVADRTMTDEQRAYRQALRDLPNTSSPSLDDAYDLDMSSVDWPVKPE